MRTASWIVVIAFLAYALTGGGRIVGSDEVTMFELSRALMAGHITVPAGATVEGHGGFVTKNAAGQAVLALPWVALSELAARSSGLDPERRELAARFGASFMNALVTALLLGAFYLSARSLSLSPKISLVSALMLGFTTPTWVYAKSFMAEPLQALGLLLALIGASHAGALVEAWREPDSSTVPGRSAPKIAALGAFIAVSVKLSMLPLAIACLVPLIAAPPRTWRWPLSGLVAALLGHAIYDVARFGTPLETGYGVQATGAAYTTPFLVGLYGLLLSSGKGVMWFAPALWLVPRGWSLMTQGRSVSATPARRAAWGALAATMVGLLLYGRFQHWAGDGSFGPRYLIPLLPLAFLPVAFALARHPRLGAGLAVLGFVIQLGGVAIYFGAQMREAGDYPYRLPLDHPRFMSESHFNPNYTPIVGHWRMVLRNLREHLQGEAPRIRTGGTRDPRLGVSVEDQRALLHGLDFWWLYLGYAGFPRAPVWAVLALLLILEGWAIARLAAAVMAETRAP